MQYESPISCSNKVMAKVKVFVHASHADAEGRALTLAPRTYVPGSLKITSNNQYIQKVFDISEILYPTNLLLD